MVVLLDARHDGVSSWSSTWSWKRDELQSETLLTKVSLEGLDLCPEVAEFVLRLWQPSEFALSPG
jgi:hypothetical protein